jgi:hypothetical protein
MIKLLNISCGDQSVLLTAFTQDFLFFTSLGKIKKNDTVLFSSTVLPIWALVNTAMHACITILGDFIILSLIGVLRIPEEFYLYKDKDTEQSRLESTN